MLPLFHVLLLNLITLLYNNYIEEIAKEISQFFVLFNFKFNYKSFEIFLNYV